MLIFFSGQPSGKQTAGGRVMIVGLASILPKWRALPRCTTNSDAAFWKKFLPRRSWLPARSALPYIAGRFAAKEAAVKALGTGFSQDIGPRQIETGRTALGDPLLRFLDQALERAQSLGVRHCRLSISHERSVAVAVVILEA